MLETGYFQYLSSITTVLKQFAYLEKVIGWPERVVPE